MDQRCKMKFKKKKTITIDYDRKDHETAGFPTLTVESTLGQGKSLR